LWGFSAVLEVTGGEAEPAVVDAEGDFVGTHLDYGVVGAVESVGGCVAAEQGGPGGPEFGVEAIIQSPDASKLPCPNHHKNASNTRTAYGCSSSVRIFEETRL
jgi:hypothetical protein